jgi:pilus assembly protein CpaB
MRRARLLTLLLAIGCTIFAAMLWRGMQGQESAQIETPIEPAQVQASQVLVAARDIAMGERLDSLALEWREWPRMNVTAGMITQDAKPNAIADLAETRVRLPFLLGEPINDRKLVRLQDRGFLSATLPKGMRAISIAVSDRSAASGFILPNDRVDVILVREISGVEGRQKLVTSRTIVANVRVLAINQSYGQEPDKTSLPDLETAVLELDPQQAEIIARSEVMGTIALALRSMDDSGTAGEKPQSSSTGGPLVVRYGVENALSSR